MNCWFPPRTQGSEEGDDESSEEEDEDKKHSATEGLIEVRLVPTQGFIGRTVARPLNYSRLNASARRPRT